MLVVRKSPFTGKTHEWDMPTVTEERLSEWANGGSVQDVFPELSADEREFIMTGITPEEWDEVFGEGC